MPRLILKKPKDKNLVINLDKAKVTIGRNQDNDVQLDTRLASRYHAAIEKRKNNFFIVDLGSKNGSYVNGIVTKETSLIDDDILRFGDYTFFDKEWSADSVVVSQESPLAVLLHVGKAINKVMMEEDLLNFIMDLLFRLIHADRGMILLIDPTTGELVPRLVKGQEGDEEKITISKTIVDRVLKEKVGLIVKDTVIDPQFKHSESIIASGIQSVMAVPMLIRDKVMGIVQVYSRGSKRFTKEELDLLCSISDYLAIGVEQARLNKVVKKEAELRAGLERFHSPEIVNMIVANCEEKGDVGLEVEEKEASILFVDICSFTPLAERMSAVDVAVMLNKFFSLMTDTVFEFGGTLDKYIGDCVMALFGVPYSHDEHADRAVLTAVEIRRRMEQFSNEIDPSQRFEIRTGINTGKVVAGNIGSPKRMDYTVLGDTVNIASRLCDICPPSQIMIGERTKELLTKEFPLKELGEKVLKGREKKVNVYQVEKE